MSQPPNLPEMLQARLKLGLFNWGKRTVIWSAVLGLLSTQAPPFRFLLVGWIIFSLISLAAILVGMKIARNLQSVTMGTTGFGGAGGMGSAPGVPGVTDGSSYSYPGSDTAFADADPGSARATHRPIPQDGEVIEIEAEVLPPEPRR